LGESAAASAGEDRPSPGTGGATAFAPSRASSLSGIYHQRGRLSYGVIGLYVFIILVILFLLPSDIPTRYSWSGYVLAALAVLFLARYISTTYSMNDSFLRAARILGGRRVRLEQVRKIEYTSIRDLGSTGGMLGSWGWRGRMWSAQVGFLDAIFTDPSQGILVTADGVPLYISPIDRVAFARELSRRVRSYTGPLATDVGDPRNFTEPIVP
jgi:hypothetical protein